MSFTQLLVLTYIPAKLGSSTVYILFRYSKRGEKEGRSQEGSAKGWGPKLAPLNRYFDNVLQ
jgi:hypothetical protein